MTGRVLPPAEVGRIEQWGTLAYAPNGRLAHVVPNLRSPFAVTPRALCGRGPGWYGEWWGTGSQPEIDRAHTLPVCGRCADAAKERDA